jgi:hypothetical protein
MGRELDQAAKQADLIFIDLFLGFHQSEGDMERAIHRVAELVEGREETPPLVVLMSRSTRLWDKRNEFRDNAGLLGSTFRVVSKSDLSKAGTLETMLKRLAGHYEDAKRVAGFVDAWDRGLDQARKNFIRILRRLDLSDLAQIRALLLDFEGQKLGEYLLDVADKVLQHEIEADSRTITSARELNKIELNRYPAPHLSGSPDLQDLVHRMVFQNAERLRLSDSEQALQIQFGDVLRCMDQETGAVTDHVLLVLTPACDLARSGTQNVFVLPGILKPLGPRDWSYRFTGVKTAIFVSTEGPRLWIEWNLKGRCTLPFDKVCGNIGKEKGYQRLGRLREMYALEIQQRLLADMGRIGQLANPPATFPVSITVYVVSPDCTVRSIDIPQLTDAVCFVGRGENPDRVDHLVLSETACDAFRDKVQQLTPADVHTGGRQSLSEMKDDLAFFDRFERGLIEVPQKNGKWQPEKGRSDLIYIHIVRNEGIDTGDTVQGNHRNAPFVMRVSDIDLSREE